MAIYLVYLIQSISCKLPSTKRCLFHNAPNLQNTCMCTEYTSDNTGVAPIKLVAAGTYMYGDFFAMTHYNKTK